VVKTVSPDTKIYAIDPHDGKLGSLDEGIQKVAPSLQAFQQNMEKAGLTDAVEIIQRPPTDVSWDRPINLLLIDALHDYPSVARDFHHYEPWVVPGGHIAFHDYADYYPGVKAFVDEILGTDHYTPVCLTDSLYVVKKC
jgi:hypothetical protein